jgi:metal-responsive CopG/Arc/MetJ family transcriptional regulator
MKRLTISLPDDLAKALEIERQRRDVPAASIIREAVASYLVVPRARGELRIANLGASGLHDISEQVEEILTREWGGLDDESPFASLPEASQKPEDDRRSA